MKLPDKLYEILKWIIVIVSPAICALITGLNTYWGWGLPIDAIVGTITLVTTFLGTILCISTVNYNRIEKAKENIQ